jgi:hypothetical protein
MEIITRKTAMTARDHGFMKVNMVNLASRMGIMMRKTADKAGDHCLTQGNTVKSARRV